MSHVTLCIDFQKTLYKKQQVGHVTFISVAACLLDSGDNLSTVITFQRQKPNISMEGAQKHIRNPPCPPYSWTSTKAHALLLRLIFFFKQTMYWYVGTYFWKTMSVRLLGRSKRRLPLSRFKHVQQPKQKPSSLKKFYYHQPCFMRKGLFTMKIDDNCNFEGHYNINLTAGILIQNKKRLGTCTHLHGSNDRTHEEEIIMRSGAHEDR